METPQRQNNFLRSREGPMDFQYDEDNPFHTPTNVFNTPQRPQQKNNPQDPASVAGQKRPISTPSTPFSLPSSYSPFSPFASTTLANTNNASATPKSASTPVFGSKFLFSPPASDMFTSPGSSSLMLRAGARDIRKPKKRRAETGWPRRSRSRSRSHSRSRMEKRMNESDMDESDTSENEQERRNGTSTFEDTSTHTQEDYRNAPPQSQQFPSPMTRDMPYICAGYLQLLWNIFLLSIALYVVTQFIKTIQRDVDLKVEEYSNEIMQEIGQCSKSFKDNKCEPGSRVPGMEAACLGWANCMERDPTIVGRAKVSAETFAEIVNSFVEPISYKTMIFFLLLVFGSLLISNFAFGIFRSRHFSHESTNYHPANNMYGGMGSGMPWQNHMSTPMSHGGNMHMAGTPMGSPMGPPAGMHMSMQSTPMSIQRTPKKGYNTGGMPATPRSPRMNGRFTGN